MSEFPTTLLSAAFVAPMDGRVIPEGGVVFAAQRIVAVGSTAELRARYPDAVVEELPDAVLLPGLVNAHAHLELTQVRRGPEPASFVDWVRDTMGKQAAVADPEAFFTGAVRAGVDQCVRFGVTTVGDISLRCRTTRAAFRADPRVRVVSFGEVLAMARRRALLEERLAVAAEESNAGEPGLGGLLRVGVSPHAPYSVEPHGYRRCLEVARRRGLPLATHLAETRNEATFLADHTGPFRDLWAFLNAWDDAVPTFAGGPIRYAQSLGLLDYPTLLAHVNYCDDEELKVLAAGNASVVYCPRTHAYFGHPPHRWRAMRRAGINVALGTDSCASSPDLNLLDELRLVRRQSPDVPASDLWPLVTTQAAQALGMAQDVGSLVPGTFADLVAFPATGPDPLTSVLESDALPGRVYVNGTRTSPDEMSKDPRRAEGTEPSGSAAGLAAPMDSPPHDVIPFHFPIACPRHSCFTFSNSALNDSSASSRLAISAPRICPAVTSLG